MAMDILKLLAAQGIEVPQDKQEGLKTAFNTELTKVTHKLEVERDNYKESLQTAQDTLKTFEGVDVKDLQGKIATLTADLQNKESEYKNQLAERDFNDAVSKIANEYHAHDIKAVMPFLDVEKLRSSKNQSEDIKAAFETVRKEKSYLFEDKTAPKVISSTSGNTPQSDSNKTQANEALRSLFGKE